VCVHVSIENTLQQFNTPSFSSQYCRATSVSSCQNVKLFWVSVQQEMVATDVHSSSQIIITEISTLICFFHLYYLSCCWCSVILVFNHLSSMFSRAQLFVWLAQPTNWHIFHPIIIVLSYGLVCCRLKATNRLYRVMAWASWRRSPHHG